MSKFDKKIQKEVSQMADNKLPHAMLQGGLSVNLTCVNQSCTETCFDVLTQSAQNMF